MSKTSIVVVVSCGEDDYEKHFDLRFLPRIGEVIWIDDETDIVECNVFRIIHDVQRDEIHVCCNAVGNHSLETIIACGFRKVG